MGDVLKKISSLPLVFGGAPLSGRAGGYSFGDLDKQKAASLLRHAYDCGVRIFDTAPVYGFGESERIMGSTFKGQNKSIFVISKCGVTWDENHRIDLNNDPKTVKKMLFQSLKDLERDFIDLYMVHWPDKRVDIRKTLEALVKYQNQGYIRHIGLCNTTPNHLKKAQEVAKIEAVQSELNLFNRSVLRLSQDLGDIEFMSWGTLDKGILTQRVTANRELKKEYDRSDCRRHAPWWKQKEVLTKIQIVAKLKKFLDTQNVSLLELALHHNLSHPQVDYVLTGSKSKEQFDQYLVALNKNVPKDVIQKSLEIVHS